MSYLFVGSQAVSTDTATDRNGAPQSAHHIEFHQANVTVEFMHGSVHTRLGFARQRLGRIEPSSHPACPETEDMQMLKSLWTAVVLTLALSAMSAAANEPYAGTWNLNVAQSKITPGPAPQRETVTIVPGGETTVKGMDADGKPYSWSFTPSEGVAVPITGRGPDATVVEKRPNERTVEHIWKMGKGHTVGHAVLSKDAKSFTYTQKGKDENGKTVNNVMVFEKE